MRLQSVDTWFDPLEMFRQIAPGGIVNKQVMNRKVDKTEALDHNEPNMDGLKIAEAHNDPKSEHSKEPAPEDVLPKHESNSTGKAADEFVPHQGADTSKSASTDNPTISASASKDPAQELVDAAAAQGADAELSKPESNFDAKAHSETSSDSEKTWEKVEHPSSTESAEVPKSIYSSAVTGNEEDVLKKAADPSFEDEQRKYGTYDAVDEHLESASEKVHPHPHTVEDDVHPAPGEAVVAPADSTETRMTHEEMSSMGAGACPFLMNRE